MNFPGFAAEASLSRSSQNRFETVKESDAGSEVIVPQLTCSCEPIGGGYSRCHCIHITFPNGIFQPGVVYSWTEIAVDV
jgi:hypothetical protein